MTPMQEQFVVDQQGKRISVLLNIDTYYRLLHELEELAELRAYDAAKASGEQPIAFEDAVAQIERNRS